MNQFTAMIKARTMEFVRDRGSFFWNLFFPVLLVFGFSFAFSGGEEELFKVGIIGESPSSEQSFFMNLEQIDFISYEPSGENGNSEEFFGDKRESYSEIVEKVRMHNLDMLIDFRRGIYYLNSQSPNAEVLKILMDYNRSGTSVTGLQENTVEGNPIRYVDWLVPGVLGMNMMFSCMFGVGFVIVRYRKNGVLKRINATPVSAFSFISAQMISRFLIVILTTIAVYTGTNLVLDFMMLGSYLNLLLLTALCILCMISLGLLFASRIKTEELAGGLLNLVNFPMMIFSGVFFSLEGTPALLQKIANIFPLTHFVNGSRAVMLEGASFNEILPQLTILTGMTLLFLAAASLLFKWE